jgi:hypothetical protein
MECLLVFIVIAIGLFVLFSGGVQRSSKTQRLTQTYQRLAQRFGGRCRRPGWFSNPYTEFSYRSVRGCVRALSSAEHLVGRGRATQLLLPWPDIGFACEIRFPRPGTRALPADGLHDLPTGPARLLGRYAIRSSDPAVAGETLNDVVAWQIDKLQQVIPSGGLCVQIFQGTLVVTKGQPLYRYEDLERFVNESLVLYDQIMLTRTRGIEFVDAQSAHVLETIVCKVCGEEIQDDLVFCRRCKTPHHRECWQYNGQCSVFACGETHFETPKLGRHVRRSEASDDSGHAP